MAEYTITDLNREFPNDDACLSYLLQARWPDGVFCPNCDQVTNHHRVSGRKSYECAKRCGHFVSPTALTIFHKSETPLTFWFHAMFLMASTRCGISAKQLQRELGVTYKTAWRMFHQIRRLMAADDFGPMDGEVEADETYVGGKRTGLRGRGAEGKTPVFGLAQRRGTVRAKVVPDVRTRTLMPIIWKNVPAYRGIPVYTDELASYNPLSKMGYTHERVRHSAGSYVIGRAHTNTIEGFWSLVKRGISGVYHSVSPQYLQAYVDEYSFRYRFRDSIVPMFRLLLERAVDFQAVGQNA